MHLKLNTQISVIIPGYQTAMVCFRPQSPRDLVIRQGQAKNSANWFRTGDVGYGDEDGFLWFVGGKDDVISSAGYRIGPGEIEDSLLGHPTVLLAAVIGKPDELRGQIVKAFVVLGPGYAASPELAREIQVSVRTRLSAHECPHEVEFIDELPMTTTGKVRRIDLRERERQ